MEVEKVRKILPVKKVTHTLKSTSVKPPKRTHWVIWVLSYRRVPKRMCGSDKICEKKYETKRNLKATNFHLRFEYLE